MQSNVRTITQIHIVEYSLKQSTYADVIQSLPHRADNLFWTFLLESIFQWVRCSVYLFQRVQTLGKLSSKNTRINSRSAKLSTNANIAGYQNQVLDVLSANIENIAPKNGPKRNPSENAIPTRAIALPRLLTSDTSVIIAMLNDILPLLMPPTKRAITNMRKFDETAHITYEHEIPI